ncbi:hypothetical protein HWV62_3967 [Athelia sp. TMB]|nr:hypothetical protein HWV62_3967 [Athelia sp. TMB]
MEAFGTLTISDSGQSRYFGPSVAGSETDGEPASGVYKPETAAPELLNNLAAAESFMDGGYASDSDIFKSAMVMLLDALPSSMRASSLCETYLENTSWHCRLVKRQDLFGDFLAPIYNVKRDCGYSNGKEVAQISPHKLAFLFLVFAQGALTDLTLPAYNEEAEAYHHYARAALALRSLINAPTVETVQAMVLMAHYRSGMVERYSRDGIWVLVSMSYRDPTRWHMDEKAIECRRRVFWEVYSADLMNSGLLGRPPSIELSYVDCAFPNDEEDSDAQRVNWVSQLVRDVYAPVFKMTLAAAPPNYKSILELDRKVREMIPPPGLQALMPHTKDSGEYISPGVYMKRFFLSHFRSTSMLFIHKCFFTQALLDYPENPLRSVYATSFLAAYRAASAIIRAAVSLISGFPALFLRWGPIWGQLFSSALIVGSTATKAPSSSVASSAFEELTIAVKLFERGAETSERARTGLDILKKIKEKASLALSHHRSGNGSPFLNSPGETAELALFGGQTRLPIDTKSTPLSHVQQPEVLSVRQTSYPAFKESNSAPMPDIHPSLFQHMSPPSQADLYAESPTHITPDSSLPFWDQPIPSGFAGPTWAADGLDDFQQYLEETPFIPAAALETWGSSNLTDLSVVINDDNDLDEQWLAFMRENGMEL